MSSYHCKSIQVNPNKTQEEIWDSLFLTISFYYNYAFSRYYELGKHDGLPSGLNLESMKKFITKDPIKVDEIFLIGLLSSEYFQCLFFLYIVPDLKKTILPTGLISVFESQYHQAIFDFYRHCLTLSGSKRNTGLSLFGYILSLAKKVFVEVPYDKEYKPGIFSAIKTDELSLIASRDNLVVKRYGAKKLEKLFESQLAIIMQSLGVYVVSTRTGISTVDLLCISSFPDKQYTFLIEAKTTNKPYSLPKKDYRALKDYVSDVRSNLQTLPPLRFVLLIAFKPAKTLSTKLRDFQTEAGIPIRFVSAQQIAELRERLVGLLPSDVFAEKLLSATFILDDNFVDEIVKRHIALQKAHSDFVEAIFSAKGIMPSFKERKTLDE